jgi:predicted nucleic-acid-binding protein
MQWLGSVGAVAEVVWVLESFYDYSKSRIAETLTHFMHSDGLEVIDRDLLIHALDCYKEKNIDFADALLATFALQHGPKHIFSFDRHFDRILGITKVQPGNVP